MTPSPTPPRRSRWPLLAYRLTVGALGTALLGYGGWLLLDQTREGTVPRLVVWLAGAVTLHDGVLAPLVLLCGWALGVLAPPWARGVLRGGLLVAGCWTLVALPVLVRPGRPANPSVLPLDYPRNWALGVAAVGAVTAVLLLVRWRRRRQAARRRHATPPSPADGAAAEESQAAP